jgi:hypothetical protein
VLKEPLRIKIGREAFEIEEFSIAQLIETERALANSRLKVPAIGSEFSLELLKIALSEAAPDFDVATVRTSFPELAEITKRILTFSGFHQEGAAGEGEGAAPRSA